MNELNPNLPPTLRSALDEHYAAPLPDPAFADRLGAQLRQRQIGLLAIANSTVSPRQKPAGQFPARWRSLMIFLRARPVIAFIAAVLALFLITGLAYAVGRLTGFFPGIGFVNNVQSFLETPVVVTREMQFIPTSSPIGTTHSLQGIPTLAPEPAKTAEPSHGPASLPMEEKEGITITVEQVVAEANRLVIAYKITGFPANFFGPDRVPTLQAFVETHPDEPVPEQIFLPDGTTLNHANGGNCAGGGDLTASWLSCQSIYAPLPDGVDQFTFTIHRLQNALPGELPEDWTFPIQLTRIPPSWVLNGVEELNLSSPTVAGITLHLRKVDQSSPQTAFQLGLEWEGQNRMLNNIDPITLQDVRGHSYPLSSGQEGDRWSPDDPNQITFASMVTNLAESSGPLTFRLNWVVMTATDQATLRFDPGKDAEIGREWSLNQTIRAGGFDLHFTQARLTTGQDGGLTLEFDIQASKGIVSIVFDGANALANGGDFDQARGVWVSRLILPALPTGPLDLTVSQVQYRVIGPWEVTWQP